MISCKSITLDTHSDLSTISFASNLGTSDKFYEVLGGKSKKCPKFKGTGGCDGASAFLTFYQAKFTSKTCDDKTISGKDSKAAPKATLKQGCSYTLDLSYSEAAKGESCFAGTLNFAIAKNEKKIDINPSVEPTQYCQSKGFPDLKIVTQQDSTSININPTIGAGSNSNTGNTSQSISVTELLNKVKESRDFLANDDVVKSQEVFEALKGKTVSANVKLVDIREGGSWLFYYFDLTDSSLSAFPASNGFEFGFTVAQETGTNAFKSMKKGDVVDITSTINYFSREDRTYNYRVGINKAGTFTKK